MGVDAVHQRHEGTVVGRDSHEAMRHDHLMTGIDRDLAVVALDEPVPGRQDAAVWVGEVALRAVRWSAVLTPQRPALPAHARRDPRSTLIFRIGWISRLRFKRGLGGPDRLQAALLIDHPVRRLVPAPVSAVL